MSVNWPVRLPRYLGSSMDPWQDKHNKQNRGVSWSTERSSGNNSLTVPLFMLTTQRMGAKNTAHTQVRAHTSGLRPSGRGLMCGETKAELLLSRSTSGSKDRLRGLEQTNCCHSVTLAIRSPAKYPIDVQNTCTYPRLSLSVWLYICLQINKHGC